MNKELKKISKYFSFILRHRPDEIGLVLDSEGWASVQDLIDKTESFDLTHELINTVVETNDKQRFCLSADGSKIKANQGHSIDVDLALTPVEPPEILFHGTAERFWSSIKDTGLKKMKRHHVHLLENRAVAKNVGSRYGKPKILEIKARELHEAGFEFYKTANSVWLVKCVPVKFINP